MYIKELNISADQILREEAEMEILEELAKDKISSNLVFYGGTALRLAYDSPRFSEDVDLLNISSLNFSGFKNFIQKVAKTRKNWKIVDLKDKRNTFFAIFNVRDEKLKHNFSVKVEAHKPAGKVNLKTELKIIKSPVSINQPLLLVPRLTELKRLKEDALIGRKKARDIFDLWYIAQVLREILILPNDLPNFTKREFSNELQVFLPKKYYPIIKELYERINQSNKKNS